MANTKITREATTTPRPMYIHHIGHLDRLSAPTELLNDLRRILHQNIGRKTRLFTVACRARRLVSWLELRHKPPAYEHRDDAVDVAATIGGMAPLVGTPLNLIGVGLLRTSTSRLPVG